MLPVFLTIISYCFATMLPVSLDSVRLFLHVLAASVWVGGQITVAGLVPVLRRVSPDALRPVGRRFGQVAWMAFAVLIVTGIWNVIAVRSQLRGSYAATLWVKLAAVAISGVAAWAHGRSRTPKSRATLGMLTVLTALGALFLGIELSGG
ncbi:MAG TPA: CopD family protein [Actinomycetota bacterium]|nr:CopD family protein [Actinomycetota bacterium]